MGKRIFEKMWAHPQANALQPDLESFPVNATDDTQRQQGDREECPQKSSVGHFRPIPQVRGRKHRPSQS